VAAAVAVLAGALAASACEPRAGADGAHPAGGAVRELAREAHPLGGGDTGQAALAKAVGDARVVGFGEATHSSRDFFTAKRRTFAYLVRHKGFRTFALEGSWSTGLLLNDYVLHGRGDPKAIMAREFQLNYRFWNTREYLDLVEWMRRYNAAHGDPADKVRFLGDDLGYTGASVYDRITGYARDDDPALLPVLKGLYAELRPDPDTGAEEFQHGYYKRSEKTRKRLAEQADRAVELLKKRRPGGGSRRARARHALAVQNATAVAQTARAYTYDVRKPKEFAAQARLRDASMAANTLWWQRRYGTKILLSSHNNHLTYGATAPGESSEPVGRLLRKRLGKRFVSVGTTFGRGSFNARDGGFEGPVRRFAVGAAKPGTLEHTLGEAGARAAGSGDFVLDMRKARADARRWLRRKHTRVHNVGLSYPAKSSRIAPARCYDVLVHLDRVRAAELLPEAKQTKQTK